MTVRINFLPRSYQPPRQLGVKEWAAASAAAVGLVSTTVFYMSTFASTSRLETQIRADQSRLQAVRGQLAQATEIRTREERVAQAEAELKALVGRQWSGVLLTLRDLTPKHVTWTSLSVEGNKMVLNATSRGLVDVAQLFGGLADHGDVDQVSLRYLDETGIPVVISTRRGAVSGQLPDTMESGSVTFRQLEFEMEIILVGSKGGQPAHGA